MVNERDNFYRYAAKVEILKANLTLCYTILRQTLKKAICIFGIDHGRNKNTVIN